MKDRNRQENSRKCFGPRYDGAVLPGAFTQNIEVAEPSRGFPTPFGTKSLQSRRSWGLGTGLDLEARLLSEKERGKKKKKNRAFGETLKH